MMSQIKELVDEILQLSHSLRFVGVIDTMENTLYSKHVEGKSSLISEDEEEKFAFDLKNIKQIESSYNPKLGKVTFTHVVRENVQQLIFQVDVVLFCVTCEPEVEHNTIVEISKLITDTIQHKNIERLQISSMV